MSSDYMEWLRANIDSVLDKRTRNARARGDYSDPEPFRQKLLKWMDENE